MRVRVRSLSLLIVALALAGGSQGCRAQATERNSELQESAKAADSGIRLVGLPESRTVEAGARVRVGVEGVGGFEPVHVSIIYPYGVERDDSRPFEIELRIPEDGEDEWFRVEAQAVNAEGELAMSEGAVLVVERANAEPEVPSTEPAPLTASGPAWFE